MNQKRLKQLRIGLGIVLIIFTTVPAALLVNPILGLVLMIIGILLIFSGDPPPLL